MSEINSSLGARIAEERSRLGLSQMAVASACKTTRESIGKYERDLNAPGGEVLQSLGELGMDVQYILTGVHSANLNRVAEEAGRYHASGGKKRTVEVDLLKSVIVGVEEYLNDSEQELDPDDKADLILLLLDMVTSETVQKEGAVISMAEKVLEFKRHGGKK